jgi:hypothetical protein
MLKFFLWLSFSKAYVKVLGRLPINPSLTVLFPSASHTKKPQSKKQKLQALLQRASLYTVVNKVELWPGGGA